MVAEDCVTKLKGNHNCGEACEIAKRDRSLSASVWKIIEVSHKLLVKVESYPRENLRIAAEMLLLKQGAVQPFGSCTLV